MAFHGFDGQRTTTRVLLATAIMGALALSACAGDPNRTFNPFKSNAQSASDTPALGVNAYLWRASLDTLSFMPLASADPYTGIINTDWYTNPEQPTERFKATVYILDTRLRADGLNVAIHRQVRQPNGEWQDAATSAATEDQIENAILVRARQIRVSGR